MTGDAPRPGRTVIEEIEVAGGQLIDKVKALVREGNVRRLRLRAEGGEFHLELPVTVGVVAGGALVLAAPLLAILGVIAALVTRVRIEIERDADAAGAETPAPKPGDGLPSA